MKLRSLLLIAGLTACAHAPPATPLRVMTYNIAAGHGDLTGIAEVIRAADADVVALQEVDVRWSERSGFADQAAVLAQALGMQVRFGPIYDLPGIDSAERRQFGLAILSALPIVEFRNHEIARLSTQSADTIARAMPGFLEAVIDAGGVRVHIFDTHLDYRPDPRVRERQVREMLAIVDGVDGPVILMGDLNARPAAPELGPLFDVLRDVAPPVPGFTYPATTPDRRIDYILTSHHFTAEPARVIDTTASDHRPVVADLVPAGR